MDMILQVELKQYLNLYNKKRLPSTVSVFSYYWSRITNPRDRVINLLLTLKNYKMFNH